MIYPNWSRYSGYINYQELKPFEIIEITKFIKTIDANFNIQYLLHPTTLKLCYNNAYIIDIARCNDNYYYIFIECRAYKPPFEFSYKCDQLDGLYECFNYITKNKNGLNGLYIDLEKLKKYYGENVF
jgi:hypothetical protein